jgi:Flp pilus assembly protein TadD
MIRAALLLLLLISEAPRLLKEGRGLLDQSRYREAEEVLRRAAALDASDPAIHYHLGLALLRQGKSEEAVSSLEKARALSPAPHPGVLYELGTAYLRTDRLEPAEEALSSAVALAPREARFRLQLGWVHYQKIEGERAEAEFRRAIELDPSGLGYFYLGLAQSALGRLEPALGSYRKAIELAPGLLEAHLALGKTLVQTGRPEEAEPVLRRALKLDARAAEAHNQLGLLALGRGELKAAAREFEAALAADGTHQAASYNLALAYERLGETEKARAARARFEALAAAAKERKKLLSSAPPKKSHPPH